MLCLREGRFFLAHDLNSFFSKLAAFKAVTLKEGGTYCREGTLEKNCSHPGSQEAKRGTGKGQEQMHSLKACPQCATFSKQSSPLLISILSTWHRQELSKEEPQLKNYLCTNACKQKPNKTKHQKLWCNSSFSNWCGMVQNTGGGASTRWVLLGSIRKQAEQMSGESQWWELLHGFCFSSCFRLLLNSCSCFYFGL